MGITKRGDIVKGALKGGYSVVMGDRDRYGLVNLQTLGPNQTDFDSVGEDRLYFPTRQERETVQQVFSEQIGVILDHDITSKLMEIPYNQIKEFIKDNIPYPTLEGLSSDFVSGKGAIPEDSASRFKEIPVSLEVSIEQRFLYDRAKNQKAPTDEEIAEALKSSGFRNLEYLAWAAGYDGLFRPEIVDFYASESSQVPQWGGVHDYHKLWERNATAIVRGMAYELNRKN